MSGHYTLGCRNDSDASTPVNTRDFLLLGVYPQSRLTYSLQPREDGLILITISKVYLNYPLRLISKYFIIADETLLLEDSSDGELHP